MKPLTPLLLCVALVLAGCSPDSGAQRDAEDEKDPHVRAGLEHVERNEWEAAIGEFEEALQRKPNLARPDLELALIWHQQKKKPARAIYHYERYLEKRPQTEKRELLLQSIDQAKVSLAAEIGAGSNEAGRTELIRLTRENNLLRQQLETVGGGTAPVTRTLRTEPPPRPAPAPAVAPPPAPRPQRTYQVRPGDTLTRIATATYRDPGKWRLIYEANRDQMKSETDIKVGQTLILPDLP
jgi:nucleoid-associated protein YgaU